MTGLTNQEFLAKRMESFLRTRLYEESSPKKPTFRPSMTISRQMGAGLERIERQLVEYLDEYDDIDEDSWALFDQSLVGKIIQDHRLDASVQPYLVENTKFPILEALEQVLNLHPSEWTLFNYTANTIRKLCRSGHAITVGRAGNFVTSDLDNTFHLRLVASRDRRIKDVERRFACSESSAAEMVREADKARARYVKRYTGADIGDTSYYDLVINTDNLNDDLLVKMIGDTLLEWASEKEKERRQTGSLRRR